MKISAELVYYPLGVNDFKPIIREIINDIKNKIAELNRQARSEKGEEEYSIEYTSMSTIIYGEEEGVLNLINQIVVKYFKKYLSIFEVKYSNACKSNE
ncbi:MAG: hypothetical protein ACTSU2_09600 [Promethearchaeota archaeon]